MVSVVEKLVCAEEPGHAEDLLECNYKVQFARVGLFALLTHVLVAAEGVEHVVSLLVLAHFT